MSNTPPQLLIYSMHTQKNYQQATSCLKIWEDSHSWARIVIVVIVIVIVVVMHCHLGSCKVVEMWV